MVKIREATLADLPVLMELDRHLGGAVWGEDEWKNILSSQFYKTFIAEYDGEIAGFMTVYVGVAETHLMKIFVRRLFRGRGIGHRFMDKLLEVAKDSGKFMVFLEVATSNKEAVDIYKEYGFRILKVLSDFYGEGRDAYLMLKELRRDDEMDTIRVALGSEDGKEMVNDHLGEAPYFYIYDLTKDGYTFVEKRVNDAPEEKTHGDPRKRQRVQEILKDCDVMLAPQVSTSFVKMKDQGKWQPVVTKDLTDIDAAMKLLQNHFDVILDLVKMRREGKPTGKIVFFKDGQLSFI
ncbi:GNAT family N-acetyltransferase [bacterium 3DAC]|nr:GNAT family N-acetyltransferase [Dictyoglomota bacterium]UZN22544.1 GNAT family N-acetyltransferase [bacterium 3DAC]